MQCIKTGCEVFLEEYSCSVHGDLFITSNGLYLIRTCPIDYSRLNRQEDCYMSVEAIDHWFDANKAYGTLIVGKGTLHDQA